MVNNNGIPIEVKKPVETVYEIKNEVPSFEEFMKTYENDDNLNYDDLNSGSIGEVKGCGPCSWNNPDCECYIEEGYVPLYLVCPAPKDRYPWCTAKSPSQFTHGTNDCGGRRYINPKLIVKCMKCGSSNHVTESVFRCSTHKDDQYIGASKSEFGKALTILNNLSKNKGSVVRAYVDIMVKNALKEQGFYYS